MASAAAARSDERYARQLEGVRARPYEEIPVGIGARQRHRNAVCSDRSVLRGAGRRPGVEHPCRRSRWKAHEVAKAGRTEARRVDPRGAIAAPDVAGMRNATPRLTESDPPDLLHRRRDSI